MCTEYFVSAEGQGPDAASGNPKQLRDLSIREVIQVAKDDHFVLPLGQNGSESVEPRDRLNILEGRVVASGLMLWRQGNPSDNAPSTGSVYGNSSGDG